MISRYGERGEHMMLDRSIHNYRGFAIQRVTTHYLSVRRKLSRRGACVDAGCAYATRDCTHVASPWPSGVIHLQRPCRRSPSTFIMCALALALARARAFNYIFASQLPRERKTGRAERRRRRRRRKKKKRGTHTGDPPEKLLRGHDWRRVQSVQEDRAL